MIAYHCDDLNPNEALLTGYSTRHAMVSFWKPDHIRLTAEICSSFVLDNGAFSAWQAGTPISEWDDYAEWAREWLLHPGCDWAQSRPLVGEGRPRNEPGVDGMTRLAFLALLAAAPLSAQAGPLFDHRADGQAYPTLLGAWGHAAAKAGLSAGVDLGLRRLGAGRTASAIASTAGVLLAVKAWERHQGHTLGPIDLIHDAAWHLGGVALIRGKPGAFAFTAGLIVATCHNASPQPRACR